MESRGGIVGGGGVKIDFSQAITNLAGKPLRTTDGEEGRDLLLRDVAIEVLLSARAHEKASAQDKCRDAILAQGIYAQDEVELKAEEVAGIKRLVGEMYAPLVVMRAWALLEGEE